ncbi:hypothetical protein HELRODRAFT_173690 [Helobdella robusta]|uniref:Uncharacterized protein n=1 Tax=Helobdella robusta TaxID=6412 RepID=T1F744_HELRO|nr:hypothetical protein HELRODRAFT_173690 [Helobdella robusta]ESO03395.1 hypothetical protein HELRODRAFT_173690 [Helobdella robusta]
MSLKINKDFAKKFNARKQREELQKLKSKFDDEDSDESSSESEDDDAKALTKQLDKQWFFTLAAIKSKNPKIYDPSVKFFDKSEEAQSSLTPSPSSSPEPKKRKQTKTCKLNDYQNKFLIERGGIESNSDASDEKEDDDDNENNTNDNNNSNNNYDGGGNDNGAKKNSWSYRDNYDKDADVDIKERSWFKLLFL